MHITCVICSDLFTPSSAIYSTQCGHIFHYTCLLHWLENSKTCPQCRNKVSSKSLVRLFVNVAQAEDLGQDVTILQHKLDSIEFSMKLKEQELKNAAVKNKEIQDRNKALRDHVKKLEQGERTYDSIVAALKEQIKYFKEQAQTCTKLQDEVTKLRSELKNLENVQMVLSANRQQVDDIIRNENSVESLALLAATLKKSLVDTDKKKRELHHAYRKTQNELSQSKRKMDEMKCELEDNKRQLVSLKSNYDREVTFLKNKYSQLINRSKENCGSDSLNNSIRRIVAESPVNYNRTPVLSGHNESVIDLSESFTPPRVDRTRDRSPHTPPLDIPYNVLEDDSIIVEDSPMPASSMGIFRLQQAKKLVNTNIGADSKKFSIYKKHNENGIFGGSSRKPGTISDVTYNGLGGSSKDDVFPTSSGVKLKRPNSTKTSTSKFKKLSADAGKQNRKISDFVN